MFELDLVQSVFLLFVFIGVAAFIFRIVFSAGQMLSNQQRIIELLEAIYKQNGGNLDDLLPEAYKDKREKASD